MLHIQYNDKKLIFADIMKNSFDGSLTGHLLATFYDDEYKFLDVSGKIVVDVGASIGDTSIYFVSRGAKRVIAYEPIPHICELMKKNVKLNNMNNVININCNAVSFSTSSKTLLLCINKRWHGISRIVNSPEECSDGDIVQVPTSTIPRADVLKMDCEGCEFDIIINMNEPMYYEIGLEFHGTPDKLIMKLRELGYDVFITKKQLNNGKYKGFLHAKLRK